MPFYCVGGVAGFFGHMSCSSFFLKSARQILDLGVIGSEFCYFRGPVGVWLYFRSIVSHVSVPVVYLSQCRLGSMLDDADRFFLHDGVDLYRMLLCFSFSGWYWVLGGRVRSPVELVALNLCGDLSITVHDCTR